MLNSGKYKVNLDTAVVTGARGKPITPYIRPQVRGRAGEGHLFVRLYGFGGVKSIPLGKIVWMAGMKQLPPWQYEIHHLDENPFNNSWKNLICVHPCDHQKMHNGIHAEEIPF